MEWKKKPGKKNQLKTKAYTQMRLPIRLLEEFEKLAISRGITLNDYIKFAILEKLENAKK